jgi:NAD(P)-dependent dehydrogenase (short-subunit alcohol dehydrogenase family)
MADGPYTTALIVGAGAGLSASLARLLARQGLQVALAARDTTKLADLAAETGAAVFGCDATQAAEVEDLFRQVDRNLGAPDVVVYNPSARVRGGLTELDPAAVEHALAVTAFGAFLVVQEAARRMVPAERGAILLTGATAGIKGFAGSAAFAMGKFALRGLAQSAARELGPKNIHVAHIIVDGGIRSGTRPDPAKAPDSTLDPDAIAQSYLDLLRQPRSAWTFELDLRPWTETF